MNKFQQSKADVKNSTIRAQHKCRTFMYLKISSDGEKSALYSWNITPLISL